MSDSKLPPGMTAVLKDPRVLALKLPVGPNQPRPGLLLKPANPPRAGDSPFLLLQEEFEETSSARVEWVNQPTNAGSMGLGAGFLNLQSRPHFTEARPKPAKLRDVWAWTKWLIASPVFVDTLRKFDPQGIDTVEIDWVFSDGGKLDGYQFIDIRKTLHAYDYARSELRIEADRTSRYVRGMGTPRALLPDVPPDLAMFREGYFLFDIFFSRELARALATAGLRGFHFEDPARRFPRVEF